MLNNIHDAQYSISRINILYPTIVNKLYHLIYEYIFGILNIIIYIHAYIWLKSKLLHMHIYIIKGVVSKRKLYIYHIYIIKG